MKSSTLQNDAIGFHFACEPSAFWFFTNMYLNMNIASVFVLEKRHGFIMLNAYYSILPICSQDEVVTLSIIAGSGCINNN